MPTNEIENVSIHKLLDVVRRRKLLIAAPTVLLAIVFAVYAYRLPPRYEAQAVLAVDSRSDVQNVQIPSVEDQLWTVRDTVLSRPVIEKVVDEFKLYPPNAPHVLSGDAAIDDMKSRISVDVVNAKSFRVGFQGGDRQQVADVANRLSQLFVGKAASTQIQNVAQANDLIESELQSLQEKLANQNEQILAYKERAGDSLPDRLASNLKAAETVEDRIQLKNTSIATDQAARASVVREMAELEKRGALDAPVAVDHSPGQQKLDELKLELAKARTQFTEKMPERVSLEKQVKDLEQSLSKEDRGHAEPSAVSLRYVQLSADLEGLDQRLASERQELSALTSDRQTNMARIESVPRHEKDLNDLMRDYATTQASYQTLLAKKYATSASGISEKAGSGVLYTIAEPARPPLAPYSPKRARIILMGLCAGLALGAVFAFGAEQLNTSFLNAEDMAGFTSLPILAEIASIPDVRGGRSPDRVVTVTQPNSIAAEQYFTLASKIRQKSDSRSPVILAITSATGGEGKTLTSLNLSIALAKSCSGKVLLVDADLRRPRLNEYLEIDGAGRKGFDDLLLSPGDHFQSYIVPYNGVSVLPTFKRMANPLGVLASDSARILLERMSDEFAFVVLDSPPIVPIADGHALASLADHVLLIARARRTPRELFKMAIENFDCSNIIGVVLNDVSLKYSRYSSAYRYYAENYQAR